MIFEYIKDFTWHPVLITDHDGPTASYGFSNNYDSTTISDIQAKSRMASVPRGALAETVAGHIMETDWQPVANYYRTKINV